MSENNRTKIEENDILISKKFDFILSKHYIRGVGEVATQFGFKNHSKISAFRNPNNNHTLLKVHIEALERHFSIPVRVFDADVTIDEVEDIIKEHRELQFERSINIYDEVFKYEHSTLLNYIRGRFYAYIYPSNPQGTWTKEGLNIVETTINDDLSVHDEYGNRGVLKIGKHQSFIFKVSYDEKDINVIRFENRQAIYGQNFRFVILSNQNGTTHEMINFGFYSRRLYTPNEAKAILGEIEKLQMKLDIEFSQRVANS